VDLGFGQMWSEVNHCIHEVEDSGDEPVALESRCQTWLQTNRFERGKLQTTMKGCSPSYSFRVYNPRHLRQRISWLRRVWYGLRTLESLDHGSLLHKQMLNLTDFHQQIITILSSFFFSSSLSITTTECLKQHQ
jgi:hypothetical protein